LIFFLEGGKTLKEKEEISSSKSKKGARKEKAEAFLLKQEEGKRRSGVYLYGGRLQYVWTAWGMISLSKKKGVMQGRYPTKEGTLLY